MRKIFSRENWEFYFEHPAVRWNVCYIVLLTIIGLNVWYLYTNFPVKHFYRAYGRLLGARENVLVEISDAFRNDCGEAIDARWESGNMHFGADFMRKYSAMLWVGLVPTHAGSMTVTVMTDRKADFSKKLVFRNSAAFDHANFAHWSFNTNKRPYMTRLKLKAKKFTYYKQRDKNPGRKPVEFCPLKKRMGWATIDRDGDIHNECHWV